MVHCSSLDHLSVLIGRGMARKTPDIIEVDAGQRKVLLERASSNTLTEADVVLLRQLISSYELIFELLADKDTTIARLRKLAFGASTEKSSNVLGNEDGSPTANADGGAEPAQNPTASGDSQPHDGDHSQVPNEDANDAGKPTNNKPPPPGHGRYGVDDYPGASQVFVKHESLCPGGDCPLCTGKVYEKEPVVFVRFKGQAPLQATTYRLQRLRCNLCGTVFTATAPAEMGEEKYDPSAASMIGLLKYGSGLPFNRIQRLQANCKIPLAASTQWEIVKAASLTLLIVFNELIRQAAQGEVVHNDDTYVKILELMGKRAKKSPPPPDLDDPDRTGLFTSNVLAMLRSGQRVALFFSGRRHAGENLGDVMVHREEELDPHIHMCDGLSRNIPKELETILANCLTHGRRNFVDIYDQFKDECKYVIDALKVVYHNDEVARERKLSAEERLAYHQAHSQSTMDDLKKWLQRQIDEKLVEPNSALGEAINYLLRRWQPLTLFLRKAGAPLDNNICERALKKAILHRKNSLFYKTRNGARVGDIYMSLIYTCELNGANALDYLNQLQLNASRVAEHPDQWLPWNYADNPVTTAVGDLSAAAVGSPA
jgi:transposase